MTPVPRISETEWEVMETVWAEHPLTSGEILTRLVRQDSTWHPKTLRTLLARLVKKGALAYEARGRTYFYAPAVPRAQCVRAASESFLQRVFGGALQPLLTHFVEHRKLTPAELRELEEVLARQRRRR